MSTELPIVTDLQGNSEPLTGFKGLSRNRNLNGERVIRFLLFPTPTNEYSYPLVMEESTIEIKGDIYRIKNVKRKSKGKAYYKEVVAIHDFFASLIDSHQYETYSGSMTFAAALNFVFNGTGVTFSIIDSFYAQQFENFGDDNRVALFQELLKRYEAEYKRIDNHLMFRNEIGNDTDVQLRFNHNVKALSEEVDTKNLSTYIKGFGKDGLEMEYTSPHADIFGIRHAPPVRDERYTTESGLLDRLKSEIQDIPNISITVDIAVLKGYETANEGDRLFLIYEPMGIETEARVMEIDEEFNDKLEVVKTSVTLANFKDSIIEKMVGFSQAQKNLKGILDGSKPLPYNVLDEAVRRATEALQSAQTELEFENGIIARDPNNPNRLVLFNSAGLGISDDGGQTFRQAITSFGVNTDLLVAGQIHTNNIQIIGEDGLFYWDGNALMGIDANNPNKYAKFNQNGVYIKQGAFTLERPDGFKAVNDGILDMQHAINTAYPEYYEGAITKEGFWLTTTNSAYATLGVFFMKHISRYAVFSFFTNVDDPSATSSIRIKDMVSGEYVGYGGSNSVGESTVSVVQVDLGVPTGVRRQLAVELRTTVGGIKARARMFDRYLEG